MKAVNAKNSKRLKFFFAFGQTLSKRVWIRYNKFRKLKKCIQKNRHVSKTLIEWNKQKNNIQRSNATCLIKLYN